MPLYGLIVPDPYHMLNVDEILVSLALAAVLSKTYLQNGFHLISIGLVDSPKTAFCFHGGKYEFTRMPMDQLFLTSRRR